MANDTDKVALLLLLCLATNRAALADQPITEKPVLSPSLANSIRKADLEALRAIVKEHPDQIHSRDVDGNTPLHLAALHGHADCVRTLLDLGADANAINHWDAPPLIYGVVNADVTRLLLQHGANPNTGSKFGMTPLISAAKRGQSFEVVRRLIDAGAQISGSLRGEDDFFSGNTLYFAIGSGDPRTIDLLISSGLELDGKDGSISPLQQAAVVGDMATVRRLVEAGVNIDHMYDGYGGTAVTWAMWAEHPDIASYLIDRGANLRLVSDYRNQTPPVVWSGIDQFGDSTIARKMVARGLDINAADKAGDTALSYALKTGPNTDLVRYLKSVGAKSSGRPEEARSIPANHVPSPGIARENMIRDRSQRAIDLMQSSSEAFLQRREDKCVSCHHQILPASAYRMGQERGLRVDELALGHQLAEQVKNRSELSEKAREMLDFSFGWNRRLIAMEALRYSPDSFTEAMTRFVRETQAYDGTWLDWGRPPLGESRWAETAWGVRTLMLFPIAGEEKLTQQSIERAMQWLRRETTRTNNERTSQLLGLRWGGASQEELRPYVDHLLNEQRSDGGWAQLDTLESDAWATGKTLYALYESGGISTDHSAYQRGVEFLLRTQFDDGSWWVQRRGWPFQPHFDSRFPHGKDQWISAAATAWSTMALLATIEPVQTFVPFPTGQELIAKWEVAATEKAKAAKPPAFAPATIDFARDIQPLLERSCLDCHSGDREDASGSFSMDSRELLLTGGQSFLPAIVPGDSTNSPLIRFASGEVEDLEMPPLAHRDDYEPLTAEQISLLRAWIDQGAHWED